MKTNIRKSTHAKFTGSALATIVLMLTACVEGEEWDEPGPVGDQQLLETTTQDPAVDADFEATEVPGDQAESPIIARVDLEGEVSLEFIRTGERSIGVVFGGPIGSPGVDVVAEAVGAAESPLDLFLALGGHDAPPELIRHSERVVAGRNWSACGANNTGHPQPERIQPERTRGSSSADRDVEPGLEPAQAEPLGSYSASPQASHWSCGYLDSWGDTLPGDWGNCTEYPRDNNETTNWIITDVVAFAAHAIAQNGDVDWVVRHKNCNSCNWSLDYTKEISQGHHYVMAMSDMNDDFTAESVVTSLSNGGTHYHDVARVHDYRHRTIWTSYFAQAHGISFDTSWLFCTETPYEGPDPSAIYTSSDWEGFNGWCCTPGHQC
jgi:hypothetical protein